MQNRNLMAKLPQIRGKYRFNAAIKTWFDVGGNAEVLFKPKDIEDLAFFLINRPEDLQLYFLGAGSNVIISDEGLSGVLIRPGSEFADISYKDGRLTAGCSCLNANLIEFCKNKALSGLEFLSGVPGSVGGAVAMNAGCYGNEVADALISVKAIDYKGNIKNFDVKDIDFDYRSNPLVNDFFFLEAVFAVEEGDSKDIANKINILCEARYNSQPIRAKTGGSTFKNPDPDTSGGKKAWQLIDEVGFRGKKIGGAMFSEKHCNFLVNNSNASASDLVSLGNKAAKEVFDSLKIKLSWEIKRLGMFR